MWLKPEILEEREFAEYSRPKIVFTSEPGERIPAYLFIPASGGDRFPEKAQKLAFAWLDRMLK